MRIPRFRFTVRRMMVAVAVVAVLSWLGSVGVRRAECRRLVRTHEELCRALSAEIGVFRGQLRIGRSDDVLARVQLESAIMERRPALNKEIALTERYRRAMRRPWLPVEPDPPPPK
jgi:hypothetical protein